MNATLYDALRVTSLLAGTFVVAVTLVIGALYARVYQLHRNALNAGQVDAWRGLLPRHVVGIAVSYTGFVVDRMIAVMSHLRDPEKSSRPIVLLILSLIGLWALWDVLGHQRHRTRDLGKIGGHRR